MPTNGISIPDEDKVKVPDGEWADDATWEELTNQRGLPEEGECDEQLEAR